MSVYLYKAKDAVLILHLLDRHQVVVHTWSSRQPLEFFMARGAALISGQRLERYKVAVAPLDGQLPVQALEDGTQVIGALRASDLGDRAAAFEEEVFAGRWRETLDSRAAERFVADERWLLWEIAMARDANRVYERQLGLR